MQISFENYFYRENPYCYGETCYVYEYAIEYKMFILSYPVCISSSATHLATYNPIVIHNISLSLLPNNPVNLFKNIYTHIRI